QTTQTFYWDLNEQTREWSKRFAARHGNKYPTSVHAGVYSGVLHYLKAVDAANTDDGTTVIARMKEMPTDDPLFGKGSVRPDGRKIHPAYLFEVKKPSESKYNFDYLKVVATIPAEQTAQPLEESQCPLVGSGSKGQEAGLVGRRDSWPPSSGLAADPSIMAVVFQPRFVDRSVQRPHEPQSRPLVAEGASGACAA